MADLELIGPQRGKLREALMNAFPTVNALQVMVQDQMGENLMEIIPFNSDLEQANFELIQWCGARGRMAELFLGARATNPSNTALFTFARKLGLASSGESRTNLQKVVSNNTTHVDVAKWRTGLTLMEFRTCRVDIDSKGAGTGFLVGPDLVLTNYHVLPKAIEGDMSPTRISCRFDYKVLADGSVISGGSSVKLAAGDTWLVDSSPYSDVDLVVDPKPAAPGEDELDFALIRLEESIGDQPRGKGGEETRLWVELSDEHIDYEGISAISILQHPKTLPLKLALDWNQELKLEGENRRLRHTVPTEPGSSGSPLFDADWKLVALHHSGDPDTIKPEYNEAIPIALIAARPKVAEAMPDDEDE